MVRTLKQYGLRRSGTNWLEKLLTFNYETKVLVHDPVWKHSCFVETGHDGYLLSLKAPHSWLVSARRYWEGHEIREHVHAYNLAERWANFARNYDQAQRRDDAVVVLYEELLGSTQDTLERLADRLYLERSPVDWHFYPRDKLPGSVEGFQYYDLGKDIGAKLNRLYYEQEWYYLDLPLEEFKRFNGGLHYTQNDDAPPLFGYEAPGVEDIEGRLPGIQQAKDKAMEPFEPYLDSADS